jgi:hypothetical protein
VEAQAVSEHVPAVLADYLRASTTSSLLLRSPYDAHDLRVLAAMEAFADTLTATAPERDVTVSVVLPVLDREDILSRAILSVLTQTHRNVQLVVVDDGSTDGTAEVASSFVDDRILVVRLPQNRGHAVARNAGLEAATGDYVAYLDSDDWWEPRALEVLLAAVDRYEVEFVYGAQRVLRPLRGDGRPRPELIRFSQYNRSLLENNNYISMIGALHSRDAARRVGGFDERFRRYSDWNFFLRLAAHSPPVGVPVVLSTYDQASTGSVSRSEDRARYRSLLREALGPDRLLDLGLVLPEGIDSPDARLLRTAFAPPPPPPSSLQMSGSNPSVRIVLRTDGGSSRERLSVDALQRFTPSDEGHHLVVWTPHPDATDVPQSTGSLPVEVSHLGIDPVRDWDGPTVVLTTAHVVTPGWLEALLRAQQRAEGADVVIPRVVRGAHDPEVAQHVPGHNPEFECDVSLSAVYGNVIEPLPPDEHGYELSGAPLAAALVSSGVARRLFAEEEAAWPACSALRARGKRIIYTPSSKIYRLPGPGD